MFDLMQLPNPQRLGRYEILAPLGRGGMGAVFKAKDSRLQRMVAIKVLPEEFAGDAERLARFEREGRLLAALNHPAIAAIYEVSGGDARSPEPEPPFLVMEFVPGETLEARMTRGPIAIDEAIEIARQIADALEAAHAGGVIHRDLKPANVMVDEEGRVKVLDFGLARASEQDAADPDLSHSPTLMRAATHAGVILGTAGYMSPEQARGKTVDSRADVWAFGVVLWEMLIGKRLFEGETVSDTLAAVLTHEVDLSRLPDETPPSVRLLIERCLQRKVRDRLQSIGDARIELEDRQARSTSASTATITAPPSRWRLLPWAIAVLSLVAFAAMGILAFRRERPPSPSYALSIEPPDGGAFRIGSNRGWGVVSPDGQKIVFSATARKGSGLWVRDLSTNEARLLPETEGGFYPFWAPDSRRLAFFSFDGLRRIDIGGGMPERICDASWGRGGSWSEDGWIVFTPVGRGSVHKVRASGGAVVPLTRVDNARGESAHYWPVALPGGKFLYFIRSSLADAQGIYIGSMDGTAESNHTLLMQADSSCIFVPAHGSLPSYLMWVEGQKLIARPFDPAAAKFSGERAEIADGIELEVSQRAPMLSASSNGIVAYVPLNGGNSRLIALDRHGSTTGSYDLGVPSGYHPALSPDGRRIAYTAASGGRAHVWLLDLGSGHTRPLTTGADWEEEPVWEPGGGEIAYEYSNKKVARIAVAGSSAPVPIEMAGIFQTHQASINFDLRQWRGDFIYADVSPEGKERKAWAIPLGGGAAVRLVDGPGNRQNALVSPDGRWLLYLSDEAGSWQPFISSFRVTGGTPVVGPDRQTLAVGGVAQAQWRPEGKEILFLTTAGAVVSVPVEESSGSIRFGAPVELFTDSRASTEDSLTVSGDGTLFMIQNPATLSRDMRLIINWPSRIGR